MFDEVVEVQNAVTVARGKVLKAAHAALDDSDGQAVARKLLALENCLRCAEFVAGEAYNEALTVKVTRSHAAHATAEGKRGA